MQPLPPAITAADSSPSDREPSHPKTNHTANLHPSRGHTHPKDTRSKTHTQPTSPLMPRRASRRSTPSPSSQPPYLRINPTPHLCCHAGRHDEGLDRACVKAKPTPPEHESPEGLGGKTQKGETERELSFVMLAYRCQGVPCRHKSGREREKKTH